MTDEFPVFFCPAQTYAQTRDSPAEHCTNEVFSEDELCSEHEEPDDDFDYGDYKQELAERWADPDYFKDFGD